LSLIKVSISWISSTSLRVSFRSNIQLVSLDAKRSPHLPVAQQCRYDAAENMTAVSACILS
jgi:hypothetical protein